MSICRTIRFGKPPLDLADVLFEPPDHHVGEDFLAANGHATAEPLRVEDLQEGGKAVGVAVVRGGGQEQPMFEAGREVADDARDARVDGVPLAARGGRVVRLVEDEQRPRPHVAQPIPQGTPVGLIDQQALRDQEPGVRTPRVDAVPAFLPDTRHIVLVEHLEGQAEPRLQLGLPLR
jgi:hypothetical protein